MTSSITTVAGFDAQRGAWESLYRSDPARQVFLSWCWLRAYLDTSPAGWTIQVVREGDELVAALPLQVRGVPSRRLPIARELAFLSEPLGDYQGMLCRPGREAEAIAELFAGVMRLRWDRASLREVADPRIDDLLALVRRNGAAVTATGESRCLRTALPSSWDEFRKTISRKTRYQTDYSLRRLREAYPGFRETTATDADIDAHVDGIVRVNHLRWGGSLRTARTRFGGLFRAAHERGCLRLHVLWDGDQAIGGAASFTDTDTGTYSLFQIAYHPAYAKYSPGKAVLGIALRDAIEQGYGVFDFLRGDEDYKSSYAHDAVTTRHFRVQRPVLRSALYDAVQPSYRSLKAAAVRMVYGPGRTV